MSDHHFVSLTVRVPALLRYLSDVKAHALSYADEGALIKTAFAETFGAGNWPKPFSVRRRGTGGDYEILAYSQHSPESLASIYRPTPRLAEALPINLVKGYPVTAPITGAEMRFHTTLCPMVRTYSDASRGIKGRERDVYTLETEKATTEGRDPRDRMHVYKDFLVQRIAGAEVLAAQPMGFSLVRIHRGKEDSARRFAVPSVTFSGILRVIDQAAFLDTVVSGIGRQRTYGFGMILLGAAAPKSVS
jgi:CRISPR system Cascade subunit CasE